VDSNKAISKKVCPYNRESRPIANLTPS